MSSIRVNPYAKWPKTNKKKNAMNSRRPENDDKNAVSDLSIRNMNTTSIPRPSDNTIGLFSAEYSLNSGKSKSHRIRRSGG